MLIQKRVQIVHYDKGRFSEGSRVRSQMIASAAYADSYLVLSVMQDEPWEHHWNPQVLVKYFISSQRTFGRFWQECKTGIWLALQANKGRFNILHAHHNTSLLVALIWVFLCGKPLIFDSHDLFSPSQTKRKHLARKFCLWFKWSLLQGIVLKHAACAVHVSEGIVNIYTKLFPETRHVLLWNLPAFALAPGYSDLCSQKYKVAQRNLAHARNANGATETSHPPLRLVYFGLLGSTRITLNFIKILASIPNIELTLYGRLHEEVDDYAEYAEGLCELLKQLPVRWLGSYKTADLPIYLADADMLVIPIAVNTENNRHAMPNKFFESCFNGVGSVCSSVCSDIAVLVESGGFGCSFDVNSEKSIRESLGKLAADRKLVESMKVAALRFVCSKTWSPDAYIKSLKNIYNKTKILH